MFRLLNSLLRWLGLRRGPGRSGARGDPYAWKPAPLKPRPPGRSGAVAVAEPEDQP